MSIARITGSNNSSANVEGRHIVHSGPALDVLSMKGAEKGAGSTWFVETPSDLLMIDAPDVEVPFIEVERLQAEEATLRKLHLPDPDLYRCAGACVGKSRWLAKRLETVKEQLDPNYAQYRRVFAKKSAADALGMKSAEAWHYIDTYFQYLGRDWLLFQLLSGNVAPGDNLMAFLCRRLPHTWSIDRSFSTMVEGGSSRMWV